ncbi:MAG TPA: GrpB family protein [Candidatus Limnocylindria bacterium]|nr:GrpB family protein [Candidatus Limnocylindria bacterium]
MPIEVVPYDRLWPQRFERTRSDLVAALAAVPVRAIEHVGSTSVPGLDAKPVLDIDVVVAREQLHPAIDALALAGYEHRGDLGIPDRHYLRAPNDGLRRRVYVVVEGSLALRNHLAVRDALRASASLRAEYAALKHGLAAELEDIDLYAAGKTGLLVRVLAEAGFTPSEIDAIRSLNRPPGPTSGLPRT